MNTGGYIKKSKLPPVSIIMYALAVFIIISSTVSGSQISRIVGGSNVPNAKYPYQVLLLHKGHPRCGGSIIDHYSILTAAHCVYRKRAQDITVIAGTNYLTKPVVSYKVNSLICHKGYTTDGYVNDIALLRVNKEIMFNYAVKPIPLALTYYIAPGTRGVVTGWGRLSIETEFIPDQLQELNVTIIEQDICDSLIPKVNSTNICTYSKSGEGNCFGDSGGPLVVNGTQVGIITYSIPCAIGYPDVYTRVFSYKDWITNVTNDWNSGVQVNANTWTALLITLSTITFYLRSFSQE